MTPADNATTARKAHDLLELITTQRFETLPALSQCGPVAPGRTTPLRFSEQPRRLFDHSPAQLAWHATFTCATQLPHHQWVDIYGTQARLAVQVPWSMPSDRPIRLILDDGRSLTKDNLVSLPFEAADQWQVQCELFCEAVQTGGPAPIPIDDAVANMQVIDAIARSCRTGRWERPSEN